MPQKAVSHIFDDVPKRHIAICIFNRATYARCKRMILRLSEKEDDFEITLVLASAAIEQEFEEAHIYIKKECPKAKIQNVETPKRDRTQIGATQIMSDLLESLGICFRSLNPDIVFVIADRYETISAALAANMQNIPVIHLQGGEVTNNIDDRIRHAVSKLSDYHFCCTQLAKEYLIEMGEEPGKVFLVGCPTIDLIRSERIYRKATKTKEKFIISQFHPFTDDLAQALKDTQTVLDACLQFCDSEKSHCYWFWPNPDPGKKELIELIEDYHEKHPTIFYKAANKPPAEFIYQLARTGFLVGNSSAGIRECSYLGVPVINVGLRQGIRERAENVIDLVNPTREELVSAMAVQLNHWRYVSSSIYGAGGASDSIYRRLRMMLKIETKGTLTYPYLLKYQAKHFGQGRFKNHARQRRNFK